MTSLQIGVGGWSMNKVNQIVKGLMLFSALVFFSGTALAVDVRAIVMEKNQAEGDVLKVNLSEVVDYQTFDLGSPSRLILMLPTAKLTQPFASLRSESAGILSVAATEEDDGVRIEVTLDRQLDYQINERADGFDIHFAATVATKQAEESGAELRYVDVQDRGMTTELVVRGVNLDASHNVFLTNNGQTMIIDFWGATASIAKDHYGFATQKVSGVTIGRSDDRVRLVVNLIPGSNAKHQVDAAANEFVVRFGNVVQARNEEGLVVEDISFQPEDRVSNLIIRTSTTNPVVDIREKDRNVIIDVLKSSLAEGQERTQDVSEFPGAIRQIDSYAVNETSRITVRLREEVEISSYQQGNVFTVRLEPEDLAAKRRGTAEADQFAYSGQKVTFDFKDIDIRNALKLIAEMSDMNLIMSDDVDGTLTLRLVDVPWDQALELILNARGLGNETSGNVMRIAPVAVLKDEYAARLATREQSEKLEKLITEFITLSYTRVEDVKKILEGASGSSSTGGSTAAAGDAGAVSEQKTAIGLLTLRGSFLIDERTNTLIVKDTEEGPNNVKRLLAVIDKPVKQVLIEARIVEASDTFQKDFGIKWGGTFNSETNRNFPGQVSIGPAGGITADNTVAMQTGGVAAATGHGFMVDLPGAAGTGAGGAMGISLGSFTNAFRLDLELSAAESEGKAKIVSNPRLITTDRKTANIGLGTDIAYQTVSATGTQVEFRSAVLGLDVTPQITADDHVIMQVSVTKDTPAGGSNPNLTNISKKSIKTEIFMGDGETVVIGGIYEKTSENSSTGIPFLKDIPILGYLFKNDGTKIAKTELLIFITPTIIKKAN
ncbi:MAG: type IV pilus secretin PilQ [Mariprofundaceae bacterium]